MLIFGSDELIARWVGKQLGIKDFGPSKAIGVVREGKIIGGAVFNNFHWPSIEVTFASTTPGWASRSHFRGILAYPFVQLDCRRLAAVTEATNQPTRAFLCRFGFVQEGFHPDALPSGAAISYGLYRKDCRWLKAEESNDRQERTKSASGT
jgi:RimJ/RimL family protein N-acetyltransferase